MKTFLTITILVTACSAQVWPHQQGGITPSVTTGAAEGNIWLKWDGRTRLGFVRGYLVGLRAGNRSGCSSYEEITGKQAATSLAEVPIAKCLASVPMFSKPPEDYANALTRFYRTYPADTGLNLETLLWLLSDQQNKTPEQVNTWFREHRASPEP